MANGLDRLERLFAYKRRASPTPSGRASPVIQAAEPQFPSPSFIRPKASRMTAREEVRLRQATERSPSVPDVLTSQRTGPGHSPNSSLTDGACREKHRLVRSPSFNQHNVDELVTGFRDFKFPKPPSRNGKSSLELSFTNADQAAEVPQLPSPRCRSPIDLAVQPPTRLDTPPSSDPEDNGSDSPARTRKAPLASLVARPPTPGQSPELRPAPDAQLRSSKSADALDKALFKDAENHLGETFDQLSLSRSYSQSSLAPSAQYSFCSSTLREPDVNEFLNLSDDDIAESTPGSPELLPIEDGELTLPPMDLSSASAQPVTTLLTLTPPRASKPALAAAYEAARIARRYDFDMVYVVNLWPDSPMPQTFDSGSDVDSLNKPMIGRLLAAHGLHHVPSPLRICSLVHTAVLKSDGWIEYRNQSAESHDFARGFSCAFYTGQYARSASSRCTSPVSGVRLSERIDRGIVFAAYRKPRDNEDRLGRTFSEDELGELHREAEVLVEMLIDIHAANRMRQPPTVASLPAETGPIPLNHIEVA